ncbi:C-C motif chemokine 5 [Sparus aurata]|uniref:C-C motif chemokine n=1 Tax=Sparus aurata TaxID=8175 RepID=A0A671WZE2_SPAAU|nr:C-C motif chemokine 5-like [Sparus aurata]
MMKMMLMMMKKPVVLVAFVVLVSSLAVLASDSSSAPTECCFEFFSRRLRTNNVVSYQYTDDRCAKKAVLFTMKRACSVVCADPSLLWVKNIIHAKEWTHIKKGNSSESAEIN